MESEIFDSTAESEDKSIEAKEDDSANESSCKAISNDKFLKHPLQNTWTLWYLENDRTKTWEQMQNEITSVDTVEDFWR